MLLQQNFKRIQQQTENEAIAVEQSKKSTPAKQSLNKYPDLKRMISQPIQTSNYVIKKDLRPYLQGVALDCVDGKPDEIRQRKNMSPTQSQHRQLQKLYLANRSKEKRQPRIQSAVTRSMKSMMRTRNAQKQSMIRSDNMGSDKMINSFRSNSDEQLQAVDTHSTNSPTNLDNQRLFTSKKRAKVAELEQKDSPEEIYHSSLQKQIVHGLLSGRNQRRILLSKRGNTPLQVPPFETAIQCASLFDSDIKSNSDRKSEDQNFNQSYTSPICAISSHGETSQKVSTMKQHGDTGRHNNHHVTKRLRKSKRKASHKHI